MRIWKRGKKEEGFSKTKLLLGAGGLLLFIVGLKRSHRLDDEAGVELVDRGDGAEVPEGSDENAAAIGTRSTKRSRGV